MTIFEGLVHSSHISSLAYGAGLVSIVFFIAMRRLRVAVAMSGGVDSSVAALLMARQGFEVLGVHMRTWDPREESGTQLSMISCC